MVGATICEKFEEMGCWIESYGHKHAKFGEFYIYTI
jgi:hypothetical protein